MTGAGPSRRSHTKSRTGCKTCKRRHIRCDELFPQCRNCTKHQVRCDYMDTADVESSSQHGSIDEKSLMLSPSVEEEIDAWKQTGLFPFPNLGVYPTPQVQDLTKDELRLIHHICSVSNDLMISDMSHLTSWTEKIPCFLSMASSFPFVLHAILSFSANHLGWVQSSTELRNVQVQHGSVALRGLHEAIGNFSPANADAILAASMLMCWQSTDWLSWSSLMSGLHTVFAAMPPQNRDRFLADIFPRERLGSAMYRPLVPRTLSMEERAHILQSLVVALEQLQIALVGHDLESHWTGQLLQYVNRLETVPPAQTPEQQFQHAYMLRKWVYWVPVSLLRRSGSKGPALLTLAHFYAAAIALQPLFPELPFTFPAGTASTVTSFNLPPLEAIIRMTDAMQASQGGSSAAEIASLMHYAERIVSEYNDQPGTTYTNIYLPSDPIQAGNISPAFVPPAQTSSATGSMFLDVPYQIGGFTSVSDNWGLIPSPGFPPLRQDSFGSYDSTEDLYPAIDHTGSSSSYQSPHRPS